jgi:hypothetical protein
MRMRRMLLAALAAGTLLAVAPADAAFETGCCACLPDHNGQTSGPPSPPTQEALFCGLVVGTGYPDFVQRCQAAGGEATAPCLEPSPGGSCAMTLAEAGIACPTGPGAPTATPWGLGALALALSGLGAWAARRRAR